MEQVMLNLFRNAEEAGSPPEAIELGVEEAKGGGFDLVVSDRGSGMTDEVLRQALLPFYSTKERGTGLGLALCREIVEAHGGELRIQRREGGGLTVSCWLPGPEIPAPPPLPGPPPLAIRPLTLSRP
jgi:signal transduction histidine kinase